MCAGHAALTSVFKQRPPRCVVYVVVGLFWFWRLVAHGPELTVGKCVRIMDMADVSRAGQTAGPVWWVYVYLVVSFVLLLATAAASESRVLRGRSWLPLWLLPHTCG